MNLEATTVTNRQRKAFGAFMRNLRLEARLSLVDVANHLGHSDATLIQRWEAQAETPSDEEVSKICKLYGISEREFREVLGFEKSRDSHH
jgi:transcriptional regulator with XRE-family HTH domain